MKIGAGALIIQGNRTLIVQRSETEHEPLSWSLFGGMAEEIDGNDPYKTMLREVLEESGIDLFGYPAHHIDVYAEPGTDFFFHTYAVILPDDFDEPIALTEEAVNYCWVELGETVHTIWANLPHEKSDSYAGPLHSGFASFVAKHEVAQRVLDIVPPHWEKVRRVAYLICKDRCHGNAHICDREPDGSCKPRHCRYWSTQTDLAEQILEAIG